MPRKIASAVYMSYEFRGGGTTNMPQPRTLTAGTVEVGSLTLDGEWLVVYGRAHGMDMLIPREHVLVLWAYPDAA